MPGTHTDPPASSRPLDAADLEQVRQRFLALNQERLRRLWESLPARQQAFLDLLPLLFHVNHPALPGFVGSETPHGICDYSPPQRALDAANRLARSFDHRRRFYREYAIEALFLMGSTGTIAYSRDSDLDVWLCHRPGLSASARALIEDKCGRVTEWATSTVNLEVHFFVMTAEEAREGQQRALSSESSGSAQHHLLLDEFYRSSLLLAGLYPLWWLVPPEQEHSYVDYARHLLEQRFVRATEYVDLGGLAHVPSSEFFGASLWQLYKGIGSPYKSLLKILLLEAYASEFPDTELLSQRFKRAVYQGETAWSRLDPYVFMLQKVEAYLGARQDLERLELARRSFYYKARLQLSRLPARGAPGPREQALLDLVRGWGWDERHLHLLDARDHWKVERFSEERRLLVTALTRSYRFLSGFGREQNGLAVISQEHMNVLGRRLFAAFERRAGKIELITAGMPQDLSEERLAVDRSGEGGQDAWLLYRGAPVRGAGQLLHRTHSLMELLAWAHFNGVATGHSQVGVFADRKGVTAGDVLVSLRLLQQQFPGGRLDEVPLSRLERSPGQVRALLVVNAAADPFDELRRQGVYLTSDRTDPLDFGGRHLGLVRTLDYLSVNTWGEVHCGHYEGLEGLLGCLCDHLKASTDGMHPLEVRCLSAERGRQIGERVQALFEDAARRLGAAGGEPVYVLRAGGQYYALTRSGAAFTNSLLGDHSELMRHLGQPRRAGGPVLFDPAIGADSPLPAVFAYSRAGAVQLFYRPAAGEASVFVVDETGALAHLTLPFHDEESLLNQYRRFFVSVLFREQPAGDAAGEDDTGPRLLCYRLERDEQAGLRAVAVSPAIRASAPAYVDLQVLIERHGDGSRFTVYCDGREFSSLDHGEALLETVARHVVDLRRGRAGYPIYITDLDLSGTSERRRASGRLPTAVYLAYKRRIEALLNEALARL